MSTTNFKVNSTDIGNIFAPLSTPSFSGIVTAQGFSTHIFTTTSVSPNGGSVAVGMGDLSPNSYGNGPYILIINPEQFGGSQYWYGLFHYWQAVKIVALTQWMSSSQINATLSSDGYSIYIYNNDTSAHTYRINTIFIGGKTQI